jgi:sec-independent protein translocase protein TatC
VDETRLPLTEHLDELRGRLVKCIAAWIVGTILAWNWSQEIFGFLLAPAVHALSHGRPLQAIAPAEIFFTYLKCALLAGLVMALPVVFWQAWAFIAPGLYQKEKRAALPFAAVSTLLFVSGAVFGYTAIFPAMFQFFASFDSDFVESAWTMHEVFGLTTSMFLAFGAAFEIPVVVYFLAISGIIDVKALLRGMPYAILIIFIVAAVLTPSPDWVSQVLLAVPMVGLYALGILAAWLFGGARARGAAKASAETALATASDQPPSAV